MVINVLNLVPDCYTWKNGYVVGQTLHKELEFGKTVILSFEGVGDVPSSFVNAAFVPLLDHFALAYLKKHLSVVNSTRQINDMIKRRLEFEYRRRSEIVKKTSNLS